MCEQCERPDAESPDAPEAYTLTMFHMSPEGSCDGHTYPGGLLNMGSALKMLPMLTADEQRKDIRFGYLEVLTGSDTDYQVGVGINPDNVGKVALFVHQKQADPRELRARVQKRAEDLLITHALESSFNE